MEYLTRLASPVGELTLASDGEVLTGLWIAGQKYHSSGLGLESREARLPVFEAAADWLERYFSGKCPEPDELPLAPERLAPAAGDTKRRSQELRRNSPQPRRKRACRWRRGGA